MNKLILILKNYFHCFLGRLNKKKNKGLFGNLVILLVILAFIVFAFAMQAVGYIEQTKEASLDPTLAFYSILFSAFIMTLFITLLKASTVKKNNDQELLLSLPIKKETIIISRILKESMLDFVFLLIILLSGMVVYRVYFTTFNKLFILSVLLLVVLLSLLSSSISYLGSMLLNALLKNTKSKDIIHSIISGCITFICMGGYYIFMYVGSANQLDVSMNLFKVFFFKQISLFLLEGDLLSLLIILIVCLVPFMVMVLLLSKSITKENSGSYKSKEELKFNVNKPFKSLLKNEITRYLKVPGWVINCSFGSFMTLILGVLLFFDGFKTALLDKFSEIFIGVDVNEFMVVFFILVIILTSLTNFTGSSDISIEGSSVWQLKVFPLKSKEIINSKILFTYIVFSIPVFVGSILYLIAIKASIEYVPFIILLPQIGVLLSGMAGLCSNLKRYRFDWDSETQIVKQDMAVLFGMWPTLLGVLLIGGFVVLGPIIGSIEYLLLVSLILISISLILYLFLTKKGVNIIDNLEV